MKEYAKAHQDEKLPILISRRHNGTGLVPVADYLSEHVASERVRFIGRQTPVYLPKNASHPILISSHGDVGTRGGKAGGNADFRKLNMRLILGHNHSATIFGPVWRVGVSTPRAQHYVNGPATNWTNTHCIVYRNGQRQLVNIINGRWHS